MRTPEHHQRTSDSLRRFVALHEDRLDDVGRKR
jgi:hypothetical protein